MHREMCEEMNVEAVLKQKRLTTTKRHFGYECAEEPIDDALRKLEKKNSCGGGYSPLFPQ